MSSFQGVEIKDTTVYKDVLILGGCNREVLLYLHSVGPLSRCVLSHAGKYIQKPQGCVFWGCANCTTINCGLEVVNSCST